MNWKRTLVIGGCLGALTILRAEDWPQWRGPHQDAVSKETGLLQTLPSGGPKLQWRTTGIGKGYSSVAIAKGVIVTVGDRDASSFVIALDEASGKKLWEAPLDAPGAVGWGNFEGPRSTPTIDGDWVFVLSQHGALVGYQKGVEKWRKHLVKDFHGSIPEWGYSESPLVDADQVVCTPGGREGALVAVDKTTGNLLWRSAEFKDNAQYSSLVKAEIGGVRQYIQLTMESVAGIEASDGKLLWRAPRKGSTAVIPTPIYRDNYVYVSSGYGTGCNLFQISSNSGKFSASEVYANKKMKNHHGGVILFGDYVYGSSDPGFLVCMEFKTGKVVWEDRSIGKGSLACADGRLWLRKEDGPGTVALIEASPKGYSEKGKFNPPDRTDKSAWSHPVISNGKLYLRDQDVLLCYDVKAPQ